MSILMYLASVSSLLLGFAISSLAENEHVLQYNVDNFADSVQSNNHFVMFYAPWCGHCQRLHPTWEQLGEILNTDPDSQIRIAKVDCTSDPDVCKDQDVTGYPTLKFFKVGSTESVKFRGTRDLASLTSFINEQLGSAKPDSDQDESAKQLTADNFNSITGTGNHFVKFYAPWCGHCQKLAPTWEDLTKSHEKSPDIKIGKLDCTVHKSVCNTLEIKGYPTLLFIKDGAVTEKYTGQRSLEDLQSFVKKMLGKDSEEVPSGDEGSVSLLNEETFEEGIADGILFVKFFAPWCGHCKRLLPVWNELNIKLKEQPNVRLALVDCTKPDSKELCNNQSVVGFPTLLLYQNGAMVSEYNGPRNVEDLYQFLTGFFQRDEL